MPVGPPDIDPAAIGAIEGVARDPSRGLQPPAQPGDRTAVDPDLDRLRQLANPAGRRLQVNSLGVLQYALGAAHCQIEQ